MELVLDTWGNSLGLRIPKSIAQLLGIRKGSRVSAALKGGKLILSPTQARNTLQNLARPTDLEGLVSKISKKNRPSDTGSDTPSGREIW